MSDWVEVGWPPDETSALLVAGKLRKSGVPTDERQGSSLGAHDPLSAVPGGVLVPETALVEARRLPEDMIGLGSW